MFCHLLQKLVCYLNKSLQFQKHATIIDKRLYDENLSIAANSVTALRIETTMLLVKIEYIVFIHIDVSSTITEPMFCITWEKFWLVNTNLTIAV